MIQAEGIRGPMLYLGDGAQRTTAFPASKAVSMICLSDRLVAQPSTLPRLQHQRSPGHIVRLGSMILPGRFDSSISTNCMISRSFSRRHECQAQRYSRDEICLLHDSKTKCSYETKSKSVPPRTRSSNFSDEFPLLPQPSSLTKMKAASNISNAVPLSYEAPVSLVSHRATSPSTSPTSTTSTNSQLSDNEDATSESAISFSTSVFLEDTSTSPAPNLKLQQMLPVYTTTAAPFCCTKLPSPPLLDETRSLSSYTPEQLIRNAFAKLGRERQDWQQYSVSHNLPYVVGCCSWRLDTPTVDAPRKYYASWIHASPPASALPWPRFVKRRI